MRRTPRVLEMLPMEGLRVKGMERNTARTLTAIRSILRKKRNSERVQRAYGAACRRCAMIASGR